MPVPDPAAPATATSTPGGAPTGVRILVVDDNPHVRRATAGILTRHGFHVIAADDGAPALAIAESMPPDLALVDFEMPTPGLTVVRRLKEMYGAAVWVAVLSGDDDDDMRRACFEAGADDVLGKPAAIYELNARMVAAAKMQQAFVESRLANERADRLLAYGSEAAAMLAHDLNNGLAVALSNVSYLKDAVQLGGDELQALNSTLTALRRMSGLVSNFVDIARFEDAAVRPQCALGAVRELLVEVADVHGSSNTKALEVIVSCDPGLTGYFDAALVERVLHNLVGNAVRYCNPGGQVRLAAQRQSGSDHGLELSVFNTGPAVPPQLEAALFSKYAKGNNGKRGLGLYFCRLACEAHGGRIDYRGSEAGPAFHVRLPGRS